MKITVFLMLILISLFSKADFIEYQKYRHKVGEEKACSSLKDYSKTMNGVYERAYYYKAERHCKKIKHTYTDEFRSLPKSEKRKFYKEYAKTYDSSYIESALDSEEVPNRDLIDLIRPRPEYPELHEKWKKKKIYMYLNHPSPAPDENEGDVHSPVNFVRSDYESMIEAYVKNDKPEEAERLAREYGESYSWASKQDTKALMERIEKQKAYYEKKKQKDDAVKQKADPKKVTAKLTQAIEAYDEAKANTQANTSEGISVKEDNVSNKEPELSLYTLHEKYNLFIVAIVIVVGMYLIGLIRRNRS